MTTTMSISRYDRNASGLLRLCPTWAVSGCWTPTCRAADEAEQGVRRHGRRQQRDRHKPESLPGGGPVDVGDLVQLLRDRLQAGEVDHHGHPDAAPDLYEDDQGHRELWVAEECRRGAERRPYSSSRPGGRVEDQREDQADYRHSQDRREEDDRASEVTAPEPLVEQHRDQQGDQVLEDRHRDREHERVAQSVQVVRELGRGEERLVVLQPDPVGHQVRQGADVGERDHEDADRRDQREHDDEGDAEGERELGGRAATEDDVVAHRPCPRTGHFPASQSFSAASAAAWASLEPIGVTAVQLNGRAAAWPALVLGIQMVSQAGWKVFVYEAMSV